MVSEPVPVDEIETVFTVIRPFLVDIERNFRGESVEELYQMLINRTATLHYIGAFGFVICQWLPGECHVHTASSIDHSGAYTAPAIDALASYAKARGCHHMSFTSSRKGWIRRAARHGFRIDTITYLKDL